MKKLALILAATVLCSCLKKGESSNVSTTSSTSKPVLKKAEYMDMFARINPILVTDYDPRAINWRDAEFRKDISAKAQLNENQMALLDFFAERGEYDGYRPLRTGIEVPTPDGENWYPQASCEPYYHTSQCMPRKGTGCYTNGGGCITTDRQMPDKFPPDPSPIAKEELGKWYESACAQVECSEK